MVGTLTASQGNKKFSAKRSLDPEAYHYLSRKKRIESSEENHAEALPVKKADGSVVFRKQIVKTIDEEHKKTLVGTKSSSKYGEGSEISGGTGHLASEKHDKGIKQEPEEAIAQLATDILSSPESNISKLKTLQAMCEDNGEIQLLSLAMLSLSAVFADVLPGYKIKVLKDKSTTLLSKEVQKLRDYEALLLKSYQNFVNLLMNRAKVGVFRAVSVRCLVTLLNAVPHFNLTEKLIASIIPRMDSDDTAIRNECCSAIERLFEEEGKHGGEATTTAVELIADFVRQRGCQLKPQVIQVFEKLRFDGDLAKSSGTETNSRETKSGGQISSMAANSHTLLSKRQKKALKKKLSSKVKRDVDADFRAAEAKASANERRQRQSATLTAVLETYFRVLKTTLAHSVKAEEIVKNKEMEQSERTKPRPLLLASLVGLGKFSHLISVDFMGDIMRVLEGLAGPETVEEGSSGVLLPLTVAERLACICCAMTVLRANLDALTVDLQGFHLRFLRLLWEIPLAEVHSIDAGPLGPHQDAQRKLGSMWSHCLQLMLWEGRQLDLHRCAGIIQRMAQTSALHCQTGTAVAGLMAIGRLLHRHAKCRTMLSNEEKELPAGAMMYHHCDGSEDSAGQEALSSVLWELALLGRHFHPHVAQLAGQISRLGEDPSKVTTLMPPEEAWKRYNSDSGGFFPPVPSHKQVKDKSYERKGRRSTNESSDFGQLSSGSTSELGVIGEELENLFGKKENKRLRSLNRRVKLVIAVMQKNRSDKSRKKQLVKGIRVKKIK